MPDRLGFVDKRKASSAPYESVVGTAANYATTAAMNARLTAINGTYFTATRLAQMTDNDKVMALRQADDPGSL